MRNPLQKRLGRELISDLGKYLVIFVFLAGLISLVSGFLVADNSMLAAYNESFEKYQIETLRFLKRRMLPCWSSWKPIRTCTFTRIFT